MENKIQNKKIEMQINTLFSRGSKKAFQKLLFHTKKVSLFVETKEKENGNSWKTF